MNIKILERIQESFAQIGTGNISGNDALMIVDGIVKELTVPKHIEEAQKYITECGKDLGFMGSPEYFRCKKLVDDYYEPIRRKETEQAERKIYEQLKEKYGK